jgi:N-acetylneuraminic acid mutarotase
MRASPARGLTFVTVVMFSLMGCDRTVVPSASSAPAAPPPTASAPASSAGSPSPIASVATSAAAVWLPAGNLVEPRNATNVVAVGTGEVLVVGSDYLTSWLSACGASTDGSDSVEIGDPESGSWERTTNLPSLRDTPALVALPDGRALLTGGAAGEGIGWSAYSSTYIFDPTTRAWSRSGLLNTARTLTAAAVLPDGRVVVAGGLFLDRASLEDTRVLDTAELWDPHSGAWSRTGRLAGTRFGATAVALADGRVLIVGGPESREDDPIPQATAEVYDPASARWSSAGTLTTARRGFVLVALRDGGAIVAGGFGGLGTTGYEYLSTVERFDPATNTWSATADLPFPVAGAAGIRLADGRVLLAGGSVRPLELIDEEVGTYVSGLTADAVLFDPVTGTWTATTPMPNPRAGASAVLLTDGSVLFVGGSKSEGEPNSTPGCPDAQPQVVRYVPGT